ncbi:MAG: hypothetical protein AB7R89_24430 [Dehalococcoidia bacterium]
MGCVHAEEVARPAKTLRLFGDFSHDNGRSGCNENLALIDVVVLEPGFVGARAIWNMERVRRVLLTRASAAAIGMAALGGAFRHIEADDPIGLDLVLGGPEVGMCVRVPIAPGSIVPVALSSVEERAIGESVVVRGPCLIALDGERDVAIPAGNTVSVSLCRDGPSVVSVDRCLHLAAERGFFKGETPWRRT